MPNSNLPDDNYLGAPNRTTSEFQDAINDLQNWVNTLQAELNALSGTTVREGAVRAVGSGASDLVINSAIGTAAREDTETDGGSVIESSDIGSAARVEADQNLRTTDNIQASRFSDAASPGDGDFDSTKLKVWRANVTLGGDFDAGEAVEAIRIGDMVVIIGVGILSGIGQVMSSASGALPSEYRPNFSDVSNVFIIQADGVSMVNVSTDGTITLTGRNWDGSSKVPDTEDVTISYLIA